MRALLLVALLFLPAIAPALPPPWNAAAARLPDDVDWALVADEAGRAAAMAVAAGEAARAGGLLRSLGAGFRAGVAWDPFDPGALAAAGVDAARPMALGAWRGVELATASLVEGADAHVDAWLRGVGAPGPASTRRGWTIRTAITGERAVAAMARKGAAAITARLVDPAGDLLAAVHAAVDAAEGTRPLARVPWLVLRPGDPWIAWLRLDQGSVSAGLRLDGSRLSFAGIAHLPRTPAPVAPKRAAFPGVAPTGDLLLLRLHLAPDRPEVAQGVRWLVARACPACPGKEAVVARLAQHLAGPAALAVEQVDLRAADALDPATIPFAWIAQVDRREAAAAALAAVARALGATEAAGAWRTPAGDLHFGMRGDRLWVASRPALADRLLAAAGEQAAGAGDPIAATIVPERIGEALGALTLADALRGGPLAGLFALRLPLVPILAANGPVEVRAAPDRRSTWRIEGAWELAGPP